MQIPWQSIQGFSGSIAIGGLLLTALTLLAAVFANNLLVALDFVSRSPLWAIVVAVPVTALSYVVGLLTTAVSESLFVLFGWLAPRSVVHELSQIARKPEFLVARYLQIRQEAELLAGSSVALVLFALACALASYLSIGWRASLLSVCALCLLFAVGSCLISLAKFATVAELAASEVEREK